MTDKLHYQDVFQTINIPKSERRLASQATILFDGVLQPSSQDMHMFDHLETAIDNEIVTQSLWEFRDNDELIHDRLVLTLIYRGLTVAIEHRRLDQNTPPFRQSLRMVNGVSTVYDRSTYSPTEPIASSELALASFKNTFVEVTAHLGLYKRIQQLELAAEAVDLSTISDQNESSSAILASAA